MFTGIATILAALITTLGGLAGYFIKNYLHNKQTKQANAMADYICLVSDLYQELQKFLHATGSHRIILFYTENGGGVPTAGSQLHCTIDYQVYDRPAKPIEGWIKRPIPKDLVLVLSDVLARSNKTVYTDSYDENSIVRKLHEDSKILKSWVSHLYSVQKRVFFLAIHFVEDVDLEAPEVSVQLQACKFKAINILKKM